MINILRRLMGNARDKEKEFATFQTEDEYQHQIAEQKNQLNTLEKEVAYWKEKALNFKKFHL